jgi:hypothetical protein
MDTVGEFSLNGGAVEENDPEKGRVITKGAFDRMPAELYPDIERAGEQSQRFYKIIDAVCGCMYPQPRYILPSPLRRTLQTTKLAKQSKSLLRVVWGG